MPNQPVPIANNSSVKILVGQKTVRITALWPENLKVNPILRIQSNNTKYVMNITFQYLLTQKTKCIWIYVGINKL